MKEETKKILIEEAIRGIEEAEFRQELKTKTLTELKAALIPKEEVIVEE